MYIGCYALGDLANAQLGIINGSFRLLEEDAATATEIFEALDNLNCASLGMGI